MRVQVNLCPSIVTLITYLFRVRLHLILNGFVFALVGRKACFPFRACFYACLGRQKSLVRLARTKGLENILRGRGGAGQVDEDKTGEEALVRNTSQTWETGHS